jgi:putative nucleotidyltransferase with HDIG domain
MDRTEALALMEEHLAAEALRRHSLASEAVMKALARKLGKTEAEAERWGLLGLLHDLDYGLTEGTPDQHGLRTVEYLADRGFSEEELAAIKRHNAEMLGLERISELDLALTCGEVVTGLVAAAALVQPDKKLASVKPASAVKKMKDKAFARSVNREHIKLCEQLGLPLIDFMTLAVAAMVELEADGYL